MPPSFGRGARRWIFCAAAALPFAAAAAPRDELAASFAEPPRSSRPWTWWHWMNGNITKEGITADLEAMRRVGLVGAQVFQVDARIPAGPVEYGSREWHELVAHALEEAARLGLELGFHNSPGWSGSGGPWIEPEFAMKKVTISRTRVRGDAPARTALAQPPTWLGFYRDIAVLAFPAPPDGGTAGAGIAPSVISSAGPVQGAPLQDGDPETFVVLPAPTPDRPQFVQFEFARPRTVRSLRVTPGPGSWGCRGVVQASDDGVTFRDVAALQLPRWVRDTVTVALPEGVDGRYLRLTFTGRILRATQLALAEVELGAQAVLPDLDPKTGLTSEAVHGAAEGAGDGFARVARHEIRVLSGRNDDGGNLEVEVPAGDWVVLRIGYTATGKLNHPAPMAATGPECDKLSRAALDVHWRHAIGPLRRAVGGRGTAFTNVLIDSHEAGGQNWSEGFREEFRRRRGYDPVPFLPALAGFVIDDVEVTERFLWDLRRTISDMVVENHFAYFAELCRREGLRAVAEPYGGPFETARAAGAVDEPMAEFWTNGDWHASVKAVASAAHTYGRRVVAAEAFTTAPSASTGRWAEDPWSLKALGDRAFAAGINRLVIHTYAMQPWTDRAPGMTMGMWGVHFTRTNTWWEQSRAWIDYCARAQHLLQQGRAVADIAFFTGEDVPGAPAGPAHHAGPVPSGFEFDWMNPDVLLNHATVRDGELRLPDGTSYRLLVLPDGTRHTPAVLKRIASLVRQGLTVLGPRPDGSPSLEDYPACDVAVERIAEELWGPAADTTVRKVGAGRVLAGMPLSAALASLRLSPDVSIRGDASGLLHAHRTADDAEIYFLSNQRDEPREIQVSFRVAGRTPELWQADSGRTETAPVFRAEAGRTVVPVRLDPRGSVFVVFRNPVEGDHLVDFGVEPVADPAAPVAVAAVGPGRVEARVSAPAALEFRFAGGARRQVRVPEVPAAIALDEDWQVRFPVDASPSPREFPRLASWSDAADPRVRYFSGTATYTRTVHVPPGWIRPDRSLHLDLGDVRNLAEVRWNGRPVATLWKRPFSADVTGVAQAGQNLVEIRVTNLWVNRLIGDEQSPQDCEWLPTGELARWPEWLTAGRPRPASGRVAFTTWRHHAKESVLLSSGLLGPVSLRVAQHVSVSAADDATE